MRRFSLGVLIGAAVMLAFSTSANAGGGHGDGGSSWSVSMAGPGWAVSGGRGWNGSSSVAVSGAWGPWGAPGWGAPGWGPGAWGPTCCSAPPVMYVGPMWNTVPAAPQVIIIQPQPQIVIVPR